MNQKKITDYFSIKNEKNVDVKEIENKEIENKEIENEEFVYGYNPKTDSNHCTLCGVDMGPMNPRQLCGKIFCYSENYK